MARVDNGPRDSLHIQLASRHLHPTEAPKAGGRSGPSRVIGAIAPRCSLSYWMRRSLNCAPHASDRVSNPSYCAPHASGRMKRQGGGRFPRLMGCHAPIRESPDGSKACSAGIRACCAGTRACYAGIRACCAEIRACYAGIRACCAEIGACCATIGACCATIGACSPGIAGYSARIRGYPSTCLGRHVQARRADRRTIPYCI